MLQHIPTIALLMLLVQACSTLPSHKPVAPGIEIISIRPLNLSLTKQRLEFRLLVTNPNAYDVPLQAMSFTAALDGHHVADGFSEQRVNLPAGGKAELKVEVSTKLSQLLGRIDSFLSDPERPIDYTVDGMVKLANWPKPIAFDTAGILEAPADSNTDQ